MLFTAEPLVVIPLRHEQLFEVCQTVKLPRRQRVVVQPASRSREGGQGGRVTYEWGEGDIPERRLAMCALEAGFVDFIHLCTTEFHLFQRIQDLAADGAEFVLTLLLLFRR